MAQMGVDLNAVARYQVAHPTRWTIHTYDEPHELEEKKSVRSGHIVCRSPSCSGLWKSDRLRILFSKYSKGLNYRKIGETALLFLIFVPNRRFIIKNLTFCDKNIKFTQF